jgi:hypothetical protein
MLPMKTEPQNEQEWNKMARAENARCPACQEFIRFDERQVYAERNLCTYCAQNIPPKKQ